MLQRQLAVRSLSPVIMTSLSSPSARRESHNAAHLAAQGIGDADDRRQNAAYRKVKVRMLRGERGELILLIIRHGAALVLENEVVAAEDDLLAVNGAVDAVGNDVFDLGVALVVVQAAADRFVYDGVCYRVRIVLLKAGGEAAASRSARVRRRL